MEEYKFSNIIRKILNVNGEKCYYATKILETEMWNRLKQKQIIQGCICSGIKKCFLNRDRISFIENILCLGILRKASWENVIFERHVLAEKKQKRQS